MKRFTIIFAVIAMALTGCSSSVMAEKKVKASGPDVTVAVEVGAIREIAAAQSIVVNYTVGPEVSVKYTAPQSVVNCLNITCKGGSLLCRYKDGMNVTLNGRQVVVDVTAPSVSEFEVSSAATICVVGSLTVDRLEVEASSAGNVNIASATATSAKIEASSASSIAIGTLTARATDLEASSSASITISGTIGMADIEASSSAKVDVSRASIRGGRLDASSCGSISAAPATDTPYTVTKSSAGNVNIK